MTFFIYAMATMTALALGAQLAAYAKVHGK